jgi:hypothetical protein
MRGSRCSATRAFGSPPGPLLHPAFTLVSALPEAELPLPDAVDVYWTYIASLGIQAERVRALDDRLNADFRAADGGYASLAELPMPQRAVVSDQILIGGQGVIRNLAEARLHEQDVNALLAEGVPYAENTLEAQEHGTRVDLSSATRVGRREGTRLATRRRPSWVALDTRDAARLDAPPTSYELPAAA